jgi:hypothetical protein
MPGFMDEPQVLETVTHAKRPKRVPRALIAIGNTLLALTPLNVELKATNSNGEQIGIKELVDLHKHYEGIIRNELDFCHKYLNFYIVLFTTVLGATITGLVNLKPPYSPYVRWSLVLGPVLVFLLSFVGYRTVRVFYRRQVEAWITSLNVRAMLRLNGNERLASGIGQPLYRSKINGGFIADWDNEEISEIRRQAVNRCSAEDVVRKVAEKGHTLWYAKVIFIAFRVFAVLLFLFVTAWIIAC